MIRIFCLKYVDFRHAGPLALVQSWNQVECIVLVQGTGWLRIKPVGLLWVLRVEHWKNCDWWCCCWFGCCFCCCFGFFCCCCFGWCWFWRFGCCSYVAVELFGVGHVSDEAGYGETCRKYGMCQWMNTLSGHGSWLNNFHNICICEPPFPFPSLPFSKNVCRNVRHEILCTTCIGRLLGPYDWCV